MHIEKNVVVSLMKTLSNAKGTKADSRAVREDLRETNRMPELWTPTETSRDSTTGVMSYKYAKAPWVWTSSEYRNVKEIISKIKTPTTYGSSMAHKFREDKIVGMKSHDWHNVLHDFLPVAIRGTLRAEIRATVYKLSHFFKNICAKEFNVADLPRLELEGYELMCHLEMTMPPTFFDIQPHLIIHLVREIDLAGPVRYRWMYFAERYMKRLKDWVRQQARPESSMAEGYITYEALGFLLEYSSLINPRAPILWKIEEDPEMREVFLPKAYVPKRLNTVILEQAHCFVLKNHPALQTWRDKYDDEVSTGNVLLPFRHWVRRAVLATMAEDRRLISQTILDLTAGPSRKARFFAGMWSRGRHFRVASRDLTSKTTQDSYISANFDMGFDEQVEFIGQIESIIRLNYHSVKQTLIRGQWFRNNESATNASSTLVEDECGYNRVLATALMPSHLIQHEPFVYPLDCNQVFLVDDHLHGNWKIVVDSEVRTIRVYETNITSNIVNNIGESVVNEIVEEDNIDAVEIEDEQFTEDNDRPVDFELHEDEEPRRRQRSGWFVDSVELDMERVNEIEQEEDTPLPLSTDDEESNDGEDEDDSSDTEDLDDLES
jgi:hypothetical protein